MNDLIDNKIGDKVTKVSKSWLQNDLNSWNNLIVNNLTVESEIEHKEIPKERYIFTIGQGNDYATDFL